MTKLQLINYEWFYQYFFRSLNIGWEFILLSWAPVSKVFGVLVGDFRYPQHPQLVFLEPPWEQWPEVLCWQQTRGQVLATCVPVASHCCLPRSRIIIPLWPTCVRIKGKPNAGDSSSTLAWKIPWMEEPGRLQSMGSQRVGHDWATSLRFKYQLLYE